MKTEMQVITKFSEQNSSIGDSVMPPLHNPLLPSNVY